MKSRLFQLFLTVVVTIWCLSSSGCSGTRDQPGIAPPRQDATFSAGQALPSPLETLIDVETFTAFCDRA